MLSTIVPVLLCLLALLAFRFGAAPERMLAVLLFGTDLADTLYHRLFGPSDFVNVDPVHLALDSIVLVGTLWVALRANRFWPLPVCSLQLIVVTGHLSVYTPVPGFNQAYWAISTVPGWLQMVLVLIGIAMHARRRARIGPYRDWRRGLTAFSGKLEFADPVRSYA